MRKINIRNLLSVIIALTFVLAIFSGCSNSDSTNNSDNNTTLADITTAEVTMVPETTYPELQTETSSDGTRIYDFFNTDYVFIPDSEAVGEWDIVDCVQNIDDFDPANQNVPKEQLYCQSVKIFDNGEAGIQFLGGGNPFYTSWTKGYILNVIAPNTICAYEIENIGGAEYMFVERKGSDYTGNAKPMYYVFKKMSNEVQLVINSYDDVRNMDLRNYDFSDFGNSMFNLTFNEKTIFPPKDKLPSDDKFQPDAIMEAGKNPGLGVRALHDQGITGKGVSVAIIDQAMTINHPEYNGKIIQYVNLGNTKSTVSFHGPLVTSLLVGGNIGTAPGAKVYYYATERYIGDKGDALAIVEAIDMIIETNKSLPDSEKIRVISISAAPTLLGDGTRVPYTNGDQYLEGVKRAKEAGILVLDASVENGIIGACRYDFENPEDVTLCKGTNYWGKKEILAPMCYRTVAEESIEGEYSYVHLGDGGLSSAIPYAAGVLAMGWQVNPKLTPDEIVKILLDTAYVDSDGNRYINPPAFIDYIKNN
ncbi:MAG: S8 family serine peptidase [Oscillospiraceae bacterium]|nr:S8 family serine peptidase [Oscillospiraceae bacterium]